MKIYIYDSNLTLERMAGTPDIQQYESNATLLFFSCANINLNNYTEYTAMFSATPNGATIPLNDIITEFGSMEFNGKIYWGYKYFVSAKFTQIEGPMTCNLKLESHSQTYIAATFTLNVAYSSSSAQVYSDITQAQWKALIRYCVGMRNPDMGTINYSYLDYYNDEDSVGSYTFFDQDGIPHLLFVGYDPASGEVSQTDIYHNSSAMIMRTRTYDGSWGNWAEISPGSIASCVTFDNTGLTNINSNNVQNALEELDGFVSNPCAIVKDLVTPLRESALQGFTATRVGGSYYVIAKNGEDLSEEDRETYLLTMTGNAKPRNGNCYQHLAMDEDGNIYDFRMIGTQLRAYIVADLAKRSDLTAMRTEIMTSIAEDYLTKEEAASTYETKVQTWSSYPSLMN